MIINSFEFLLFFIIFFVIYYIPRLNTRYQNLLLLVGSYFFYGYASLKMLPLLIAVTIIFYYLGLAIQKSGDTKKASILTALGVWSGVGILLYFKYFNFFITSFSELFESFGLQTNWHTFNIIMPLGISFFTFKLISYIIEIHRGHIEADRDFISFAAYVSFFPCILSGPIDRPNSFIPQLSQTRHFDYDMASDGLRQILWGMFKKMVLADNIAVVVDQVWNSYTAFPSSTLILAAVLYSFQMYTDFSGYSDMAIGVGKILGVKVTPNFNYPFFALNIADYWRRWHMSLTSWLTDYIFMPLNVRFRDWGNWGMIVAIIINLVAVGMWHGDNWTFAAFGLYHGLLFVPLILTGAFFKKNKMKTTYWGLPTFRMVLKMLFTFMLVTIGLVIFKAHDVTQAFDYLLSCFGTGILSLPKVQGDTNGTLLFSLLFIIILLVIEWKQRSKEYGLSIDNLSRVKRLGVYSFFLLVIYFFGTDTSSFIYFQF